MKNLDGRTAVVTGAASGIGLGMVEAFVLRGMKVVMADVEELVLMRQANRLREAGNDVTPCLTDVRQESSLKALLHTAIEACGNVHVLCNNAGVSLGDVTRPIWEAPQEDWDWVTSVNFGGTVNGIRAFVPHMLGHGEESHIVNTASINGLTTGFGTVYSVIKHATVRLTEGLYHDLHSAGANIAVTLLCPGPVATNIAESDRNRPQEFDTNEPLDAARAAVMEKGRAYLKEHGLPPREVGDMVANAILQEQFYLLTHPDHMQSIEKRFQHIKNLSNPTPMTLPTVENRK